MKAIRGDFYLAEVLDQQNYNSCPECNDEFRFQHFYKGQEVWTFCTLCEKDHPKIEQMKFARECSEQAKALRQYQGLTTIVVKKFRKDDLHGWSLSDIKSASFARRRYKAVAGPFTTYLSHDEFDSENTKAMAMVQLSIDGFNVVEQEDLDLS